MNKIKKFALFSIVSIAAIFTFNCSSDSGNGDNSGNGGNGGDNGTDVITDGRLTITGLSEHNGKYVWASKATIDKPRLEAFGSYLQKKDSGSDYDSNSKTAGLITNGSVTLKVYKLDSYSYKEVNYTGNDTGVMFRIYSRTSENSSTQTLLPGGITVNFSNGIGSGTYNPNMF